MQFMEMELNDCKSQLVETKKAQDATLKALEMHTTTGSKVDKQQLLEVKEKHLQEKKQLESDFEFIRKKLQKELSESKDIISHLELDLRVKESDWSKEINEIKSQMAITESQREKLEKEIKNIESQKMKIVKEIEERYQNRINNLEKTIEELKNHQGKKKFKKKNINLFNKFIGSEGKDMQMRSEEAIQQLRTFYEAEKERLERRVFEEKEKSDKRYNLMVEEYEERIREEQNNLEEEIENLKDELREHEIQSQNVVQQYEHEMDLRQKTIENLEKMLKESKENLANIQVVHQTNVDTQMQNFNLERGNLSQKLELIKAEIALKDKEIVGLIQKKEQLDETLKKKEDLIEQLQRELAEEKNITHEKFEDMSKR